MKTIFGIFAVLLVTAPAMAQDLPPFKSLVCEGNGLSLKVEIQPTGVAVFENGESQWQGTWQSTLAPENTRLSGYHYLNFVAKDSVGKELLSLNTIYSKSGRTSGGWLEMGEASVSVNCKAPAVYETASACRVPPQNDCSVSPKRLCCSCVGGGVECS